MTQKCCKISPDRWDLEKLRNKDNNPLEIIETNLVESTFPGREGVNKHLAPSQKHHGDDMRLGLTDKLGKEDKTWFSDVCPVSPPLLCPFDFESKSAQSLRNGVRNQYPYR